MIFNATAMHAVCGMGTVAAVEACATANSAILTDRMFYLTIVATACSILNTFLLVATVYLAKKATDAATRATEISARAIVQAERVTIQELRPILSLKEWKVGNHWKDNEWTDLFGYNIELCWVNRGKSYATHTKGRIGWEIFPKGKFPNDFDFNSYPMSESSTTVAPDHEISYNVTIPKEELQKVWLDQSEIHLWCCIQYDGKGDHEPYGCELHVRVEPQTAPTRKDVPFRFFTENRFNATDGECTFLRG